MKNVVDERRKEVTHEDHDLLAALLRQNMADQQIIDLIISLLVAGYETTSMIMTLAVKFLTDHRVALMQIRVSPPKPCRFGVLYRC